MYAIEELFCGQWTKLAFRFDDEVPARAALRNMGSCEPTRVLRLAGPDGPVAVGAIYGLYELDREAKMWRYINSSWSYDHLAANAVEREKEPGVLTSLRLNWGPGSPKDFPV